MFESIKTKLWDLLKEKKVSLAMLFNSESEILWHRGREIKGRTIGEGENFSKTYIIETLNNRDTIERENVIITTGSYGLSSSAQNLNLRSLIILPVSDNYYLYIDSGIKESFSETDREVFKVLGELLGNTIDKIRKSESDIGGITGTSNEIQNIRELVLKYSIEEQPILLHGETGSGKSHIAELIHQYSGRKGNFITISTPSIPDNLFESEVFGHKKGAFTDAKSDKRGFVDEADGGTLFFDEISEIPASFQAKLLRFIETKKYTILGESTEKEADLRIVAATNKNLNDAINRKEFREDLYYRLQVLEIEIPPLRERREDIRALVKEKIQLLKGKEIGKDLWDVVYGYDWPGNVRELITVLTRAGILLEGPVTGKNITDIIKQSHYKKSFIQESDKTETFLSEIKSGKNFWDVLWKPFINRDLDRETVKTILKQTFDRSQKNFKKMIKILNIDEKDYSKFISLINQYRINPKNKS